MGYILRMDLARFFDFIEKALVKEEEYWTHWQWIVQLPFMSQENFISFKSYKSRLSGTYIDMRPISEIIKEIEDLHGIKIEVE